MTDLHPVGDLQTFAQTVLCRYGLTPDDARVGALRMLDADVRGMSGHGIFRLPAYARRFEAGGYNPRPDIRAVHETPVSALVDGDNGFGQVVVTRAAETAATKAIDNGMAWVGVRGSNHAGAAGVYAAMALEHDLIGLYMAVGSSNHLPPWGGVDPLLSTNPVAVAIPAGDEPPVVLDMATTVVSYGRIKVAAERGETLPEGWMVDRSGAPLTDPTRSSEGFLLPIGGYKGYGLGLVIGLLAGVLNGAAFGSAVVDFTTDHRTPPNTGQTILMVRPDLFQPLGEFRAAMDESVREIRGSTRVDARVPIRLPGDRAPQRTAAAQRDGVSVAPGVAAELRQLADRLGIDLHPF